MSIRIDEDERERSFEEIRLLYQTSVNDIAFFKQQQWKITYYGLLLYSVIVGVKKFAKFEYYENYILGLFAIVIFVSTTYIQVQLEKALLKNRKRLKFISEESFTKAGLNSAVIIMITIHRRTNLNCFGFSRLPY